MIIFWMLFDDIDDDIMKVSIYDQNEKINEIIKIVEKLLPDHIKIVTPAVDE